MTFSGGCIPYSQQACEEAVKNLGLQRGSASFPFVGDYKVKGCYAYNDGSYANIAWYGTGGSIEEISKPYISTGVFRPFGYDCSTDSNNFCITNSYNLDKIFQIKNTVFDG